METKSEHSKTSETTCSNTTPIKLSLRHGKKSKKKIPIKITMIDDNKVEKALALKFLQEYRDFLPTWPNIHDDLIRSKLMYLVGSIADLFDKTRREIEPL